MLVSCKFQLMVMVSTQKESVGLKQLGRSLRQLDYTLLLRFQNVSQYKKCSYLNPFQGKFPFYTPPKTSEIIGFLMFSAGVQREHCPETDEVYRKKK